MPAVNPLWTLLSQHRLFVALCACFWAMVWLYGAVLPPFEGPDEKEHLAYVLHLRQTGQYPTYDDQAQTPINQQVGQPPLYYTLAALYSLPLIDASALDANHVNPNPWTGYPAAPTSTDNRNNTLMNPVHHFLTPEQARLSQAVYALRGLSVVLGWLALTGIYWGGLALWQSPGWAVFAALIFGFAQPVLQTFSAVTNDAAVLAFSALALGGSLQLVRRWDNRRLLVVTGLFLALAALSKVSGLIFYPVAALAVLMGWWQAGRPNFSRLIRAWLILAVVAGGLAGWWYVRGLVLYADPFGTLPHQQMYWGFAEPQPLNQTLARLPVIAETFWFNAGWGEVRPPGWFYLLPNAVLLAAGLGVLRGLRRVDGRALLLLLVLALGFVALIRWMQTADLVTGRLYLPYTPALALLVVWAMRHAPWATLWRAGLSGASGVLAILGAVAVVYPALAAPAFVDAPPADLRGGTADFGVAKLLGYRLENDVLRVGERPEITLCWQAAPGEWAIPVPYAFSVQVITITSRDPLQVAEPIVGGRESYPGLGKYTLWQPGSTFCDTFDFPLHENVVPGQEYALFVTLFDPVTTAGIIGYSPDGGEGRILGTVRVE